MNSKSKKLIVIVLILIIIIMATVTFINWSRCSLIETIDASITVKDIGGRKLLGMNTDTDSLKFGAVSPGIEVKRIVKTQHSKDSSVTIISNGELSNWLKIEPEKFFLQSKETKEIQFILSVPLDATDGNYTGKVSFCFSE